MSKANDDLAKRTRQVFHKLHLEQLGNKATFSRHSQMVESDVLGLPSDYFVGKYCVDLGCGSAVFGAVNLLELGAKFVHAMDVDVSFIEPAKKRLESNEKFDGRWQLDIGSLMNAPYQDGTFDFVVCHGVLHHTEDPQHCLREIARVLTSGGKTYVTVLGKGGIAQRFVLEILRDEYRTNPDFRALMDSVDTEERFKKEIRELKESIVNDDTPAYHASVKLLEALEVLINHDLVLSLRDLVQAPTYVGYSEAEFSKMLEAAGFSSWYRFGKKLKFDNLRKMLAPLYYDYKSPLARLLYNDGEVLNVVATK